MTKPIFSLLMAVVLLSTYRTSAQSAANRSNADKIASEVLCAAPANLIQVKNPIYNDLKIYKAKNGGFVIISDTDNKLLAYSPEGDFDPENISPALKHMLSTRSKAGASVTRRAQYTPKLLNTANYHQEAPYNSRIKDGGLVGCVGTALSIIMKYHQWPDSGEGKKEYSYSDESGNTVNHAYDYSEPFDWKNTLDKYEKDSQYTEEQLNAIASLSYASAVAAGTVFGSCNSPGSMNEALSTIWDNLHYDVASRNLYRMWTSCDWESSIRDQIDENLPVMYGGGEHSFVVDGYDENGLFHINWGWGGSANGYFDLDMLSPSPGENYSDMANALFWIRPRRDKKKPLVTIEAPQAYNYSGKILSNRERVLKNQKVLLSGFSVRCYEVPGDLILGVAMLDRKSNIKEVVKVDKISKSDLLAYYSQGFSGHLEPVFSMDAVQGDYLSIFYKFAEEDEWKRADTRAHIENICPAYDNEVSRVTVTWINEDQFNINLLWDSNHDSFAIDEDWGAIISPRDANTLFNVRINGETSPQGIVIDRNDEEIMISINSSTMFRGNELNIELISIPITDITDTPVTISGLEAGTLRMRAEAVSDPRLTAALIINGNMNSEDFGFIRNGMLSLANLDMRDVRIESDGIIPNDYIVENAFRGMRTMKSILLPTILKGIGSNAFYRTGIEEISIPSGARDFGAQVFVQCDNLMKVTIAQNTPPYCTMGGIFSDGISKATLTVPVGAKEAYASDMNWNLFGNITEDERLTDAVENPYAEKTAPYSIINGHIISLAKCSVYDCLGHLIGEGHDITLPRTGIYLILCNGNTTTAVF